MGSKTLTVDGATTSTAHRLTHYDGVCGNVHGHNIEWNIRAEVHYDRGDENMPVDFKDVSDMIDLTDHAILLNKDDPLTDALGYEFEDTTVTEDIEWVHHETGLLGEVLLFDGDPTTELISDWMALLLLNELDPVFNVSIKVKETGKYQMSGGAHNFEQEDE
jgi:6-pyruvoyl-tetrahydropterin synthase